MPKALSNMLAQRLVYFPHGPKPLRFRRFVYEACRYANTPATSSVDHHSSFVMCSTDHRLHGFCWSHDICVSQLIWKTKIFKHSQRTAKSTHGLLFCLD